MISVDDFRFKSHKVLLELDAATNQLMMLVVANDISGARWTEATMRQKHAYDAWATLLCGIETDPMPCLDGRPPGSFSPPRNDPQR
jgi:hypothetical protein